MITNQFAAEYGRNSGSIVSVVTKNGTNQYHGSAFWFHNDNHFNACSNTDKAGRPGGYCNPNATSEVRKGAPFTPLNGSDPAGALSGIDSLVGSAIRPNLNTSLDVSSLSVIELLQAGGARLFQTLQTGQRVGTAGRNILRADGIGELGFGLLKNTRIAERHQIQLRADLFNSTNTRNFGIPEGRVNAASFLNQWATNGGNRRIILGLRYTF